MFSVSRRVPFRSPLRPGLTQLVYRQRQHCQHRSLHRTTPIMSAEDIVTAYEVAVPAKQEQNLPGLDKKLARMSLNHPHPLELPDS